MLLRNLFKSILGRRPIDKQNGISIDISRGIFSIDGPIAFQDLLESLIFLILDGSILYFEGSCPDVEMYRFLSKNSIPPQIHIVAGTIWPKPQIFHLPYSESIINSLIEINSHNDVFKWLYHFHIYENKKILIQWNDALTDSILLSIDVSEEKVRSFVNRINKTYFKLLPSELVQNEV